MNQVQIEAIQKTALAEMKKTIAKYEASEAEIAKKKILKVAKQKESGVLSKATLALIEARLATANVSIETQIEKNLQQFVKGKHHKKKKVRQIVKHSIKVPLAIAAIPAAFALSLTGLGTPLGVIAMKNCIGSVKEAFQYAKRHKKGIVDLERRIEAIMKLLVPAATRYADLAEKAAKGDKDARATLKIIRHNITVSELEGYAWEKFTGLHSKTISHLADLVDKYRKGLNKQKFATINLGRKIEKMQDEMAKAKKHIAARNAEIASMPTTLKEYGPKFIASNVAFLTKWNAKDQRNYDNMSKEVKFLDAAVDGEVEMVVQREIRFEAWVAHVGNLKDMRPKAVAKWKKWIKGLAFAESVGEIALGGTSDVMGGVGAGIETVIATVGYLGDASDVIVEHHDKLKKLVATT
jgi:hypothetical protein